VVDDQAQAWSCVRRGKQQDVACADRVRFTPTSTTQGVIEGIETRTTLFWRADGKREKFLAANVDQVLIVSAGEPTPYPDLISRCLVAAEANRVDVCLLLNKTDLGPATAAWRATLSHFASLGYPLLEISARTTVDQLRPTVAGRHTLLVGQSGMGKSTLLNALVPEAKAATQLISLALDSGRHTTTATRAYPLPEGGWLIDSPGVQSFGLTYLDPADLVAFFPEFSPLQGHCRFPDCRHRLEPDCALRDYVAGHPLRALRLATLLTLQQENALRPSMPAQQRRRQPRAHDPEDDGSPN
jgi:ribosome biogenesis GTPase